MDLMSLSYVCIVVLDRIQASADCKMVCGKRMTAFLYHSHDGKNVAADNDDGVW